MLPCNAHQSAAGEWGVALLLCQCPQPHPGAVGRCVGYPATCGWVDESGPNWRPQRARCRSRPWYHGVAPPAEKINLVVPMVEKKVKPKIGDGARARYAGSVVPHTQQYLSRYGTWSLACRGSRGQRTGGVWSEDRRVCGRVLCGGRPCGGCLCCGGCARTFRSAVGSACKSKLTQVCRPHARVPPRSSCRPCALWLL